MQTGWKEYWSSSLRIDAVGWYDETSGELVFAVSEVGADRFMYADILNAPAKPEWTVMPNVLTIDEAKAVALANWRLHHEHE